MKQSYLLIEDEDELEDEDSEEKVAVTVLVDGIQLVKLENEQDDGVTVVGRQLCKISESAIAQNIVNVGGLYGFRDIALI
jgi:hypothetical protein